MDRKEIGKKIKLLRETHGWTQGKLATKAGISPSYIPDLENGKKCPSVEVLDSICFAFSITLAEFFRDKESDAIMDKISTLTEQQRELLNAFLISLGL